METTHNSVEVKLGIKVMKLVESLIGREDIVTLTLTFVLKRIFSDSIAAGCIVFHKHTLIFSFYAVPHDPIQHQKKCHIPGSLRSLSSPSPLWILSKAVTKSMKLVYNGACHSTHCFIIFLRMNIWSVVPLSFLKPACSFLMLHLSLSLFSQSRCSIEPCLAQTVVWPPQISVSR